MKNPFKKKKEEYKYHLPQTPEEVSVPERIMLMIHKNKDFSYIKDENYRKAMETLHKEYHKEDAFMQDYIQ